MIVRDNAFIAPSEAKKIEEFVLSSAFPWTLSKGSVDYDDTVFSDDNTVDHFQFTHMLYAGGVPQSQFFNDFHELFLQFVAKNRIEYKAMMRMKLNLIPNSPDLANKYMPPHIDAPFDHKVFIYYVNDSDGNTVLFDDNKKIVESVTPERGLGISFDGLTYHSNRFPVENDFRCVLNVAFL